MDKAVGNSRSVEALAVALQLSPRFVEDHFKQRQSVSA
jgi:hypothetical protein